MSGDNGGAHPAIATRLAEQMRDLTHLIDSGDVETISHDAVFTSAQELLSSLEAAVHAAQQQRRMSDD